MYAIIGSVFGIMSQNDIVMMLKVGHIRYTLYFCHQQKKHLLKYRHCRMISTKKMLSDMADGEFNAVIIDFRKASLDGQGKSIH